MANQDWLPLTAFWSVLSLTYIFKRCSNVLRVKTKWAIRRQNCKATNKLITNANSSSKNGTRLTRLQPRLTKIKWSPRNAPSKTISMKSCNTRTCLLPRICSSRCRNRTSFSSKRYPTLLTPRTKSWMIRASISRFSGTNAVTASSSTTAISLRHRCYHNTSSTTTIALLCGRWICMIFTKLATSKTRSASNTSTSTSKGVTYSTWSSARSRSRQLTWPTRICSANTPQHLLKSCLAAINRSCGPDTTLPCRWRSHDSRSACWRMGRLGIRRRQTLTRSWLFLAALITIIQVNWSGKDTSGKTFTAYTRSAS